MNRSAHTSLTPLVAMLAVLALGLLSLLPAPARAADAKSIDANADAALTRFKKDVKGADDYLKAAKGVLVMPDVKKAGFVVGGQWGEGALRVDGKTVDYFKMEVGSIGFQAGYQKSSFVFLFLTQAALDEFRASQGWTAGVEGGITVVDAGFGGSLDTLKGKDSVVGFAFGKEGLAGGWSAKGAKFTKIVPDQ